jgi:hypothetical protein
MCFQCLRVTIRDTVDGMMPWILAIFFYITPSAAICRNWITSAFISAAAALRKPSVDVLGLQPPQGSPRSVQLVARAAILVGAVPGAAAVLVAGRRNGSSRNLTIVAIDLPGRSRVHFTSTICSTACPV